MQRLFEWIRTHKLILFLLIVIAYLFLNDSVRYKLGSDSSQNTMEFEPARTTGGIPDLAFKMPQIDESPPTPDVEDRLVVSNSYLSLLVDNVVDVQKQIIQTAEELGGYMVNSELNNPQDAPTATVTVRVPSAGLQESLETYRGLAIKVISENLEGEDVTDQYVDNEARLDTLNKTKDKFEELLAKTTQIQDILQVQREIINLQAQIDAIKGNQNYLEKNAQMAKLTIYLSTDELALPYAPSETWRPEVIFKQAVRSLIGLIRKGGTILIWLLVYSVIWVPLLILLYFLNKKGYLNFFK